MMIKKEITVKNEYAEASREQNYLITHFKSVILSTVDDSGEPNASYAPASIDENYNFYIYVSTMARHSANLKATGKASLMIIEDESTAATLLARKRLTLDVKASVINRKNKRWNSAFDLLRGKFQKKIDLLKTLIDFDLFLLKPNEGTLVYGFGKAFRVFGKRLKQIDYVNTDRSHKRKQ